LRNSNSFSRRWSVSQINKSVCNAAGIDCRPALPSPGTGIPVIDVSNLAQNVVTAMKQVSAYAQQVQQYQLQLQ
jgi:conjugal transfer/entry exclusion protein